MDLARGVFWLGVIFAVVVFFTSEVDEPFGRFFRAAVYGAVLMVLLVMVAHVLRLIVVSIYWVSNLFRDPLTHFEFTNSEQAEEKKIALD